MKITLPRGLAALCLLCVLPKLGATVIQVGTINGSASGVGRQSFNIGGNWIFNLHDPADGPLHSVSLQIETAVTVFIQETNFTGTPMLFAPNVDFSTYFGLFTVPDQNLIHLSTSATSQHLTEPFTLAANESRNVSHTFVHRTTYTADAAALASLIGTGNGRLFLNAIVQPYTDRGTVNVTGATIARLTFNVPDDGTPLPMLVAALGAFGLFRLRFCR